MNASRAFENTDGSAAEQKGYTKPGVDADGKPAEIQVMEGSYTYVDPEGKVITVKYIADENVSQVSAKFTDRWLIYNHGNSTIAIIIYFSLCSLTGIPGPWRQPSLRRISFLFLYGGPNAIRLPIPNQTLYSPYFLYCTS
jgi:hypothetical protein